jgi:hypothetical protein
MNARKSEVQYCVRLPKYPAQYTIVIICLVKLRQLCGRVRQKVSQTLLLRVYVALHLQERERISR